MSVSFYKPYWVDHSEITYVVIASRYKGKWIFVRHWKRDGFELPAGKIRKGETSDETAARELQEETGAIEFSLIPLATYSVTERGKTGYGMLYFAKIDSLDEVKDTDEISELRFFEDVPDDLNFKDIQTELLNRVIEYLNK